MLTPDEMGGVVEGSDEYHSLHFHHWTQQVQPARYAGTNEKGEEMWWYLGQEGDGPHGAQAYPVCWIGPEIRPHAEGTEAAPIVS